MHDLLELFQNGHHSIVFISMDLYYRHHSNECYCCFRNTTCNIESCPWCNTLFILVVHTSQYPSLVWKILNGLASVSHVPYFWFNSLVMIGFGLAPVYTDAMSIVWNFSSSFWSDILFQLVFTVVCSGGDGGPCFHKTHCVAWNVFLPSIVSSKTSMLSNDESIIRPGVYGDIPVGIYL